MAGVPWLKWYPADWRSETTLRMVGRPARSLWVDLIGIMHEAEPYGHLLIGGLKPTLKQLSQILGDPVEEIAILMHELETNGVCSKNHDGVLFSRRMVKDRQKSTVLSEAGKSGGNPGLKGRLKPEDKPSRARVPEARSQKLETLSLSPRTPWPADKQVPEAWAMVAAGELQRLGLPAVDMAVAAAKFANHHSANPQPRTLTEWQARFQNWIIDEVKTHERKQRNRATGQPRSLAASIFRE